MIHLIIELIVILMFILIFLFFKDKRKMLIYSLVFSTVFELLGLLSNGYTYNQNFSFSIFNLPLFVVLSWSIIIVTSYTLVSKITTHRLTKALICSLSVISVDLVFEAPSVAIGLWKWTNFSNSLFANINPYNFIGWLIVSFLFVYFYEKRPIYSLVLALPVYVLVGVIHLGLSMIPIVESINSFIMLFILYLVFVISSIVLYSKHRIKEKKRLGLKELILVWLFRAPFFLFGIAVYIWKGDFNSIFVLLIMFIGIMQEIILYILIIAEWGIKLEKRKKK